MIDDLLERHAARWQREVTLPEVRLVPPRRARWPYAAAVATAAAVAVAAVVLATGPDTPGRLAGRPTPSAPSATSPTTVPDLDRYDAAAAAFFAPFAATGGGSEAEHYASLRDAYRAASVVVVAEVAGVRVTRTLNAGTPDAVTYVGVVLRPVEVLRGALRDPAAREVVVEFLGDPASAAATVPGGYGVWLLRNKGDLPPGVTPKPGAPPNDEAAYYRLVSSQGLFVQGDGHVTNPVRERPGPEPGGPRDAVAREAESFGTLSALVAHLRGRG